MASFVIMLGRLCLAVVFLMAGVDKFLDWSGTLASMKAAGMASILGWQIGDMLPVLLAIAALAEIVGGLAFIFGNRTRLAAAFLALFLISTTLIFHQFWAAATPELKQLQTALFFKNVATLGGLLVLLGSGAGCMSTDAKRRHRDEEAPIEEEPG